MATSTSISAGSEIHRIEQAYARRRMRVHSFWQPSSIFIAQEIERHFLRMVRQYGLDVFGNSKVLDVGGAGGFFVRSLLKYGAQAKNLHSIDLFEERLHEGHEIVPTLRLMCADGQHLPFQDESFDIVVQQTMFSSVIRPELRRAIGLEMLRVLKPGGALLSFDMRFIRPGDRDMCAITRAELERIFPNCQIDAQPCGLPPFLARRLAPLSFGLCQLVSSLWPIKTHCWAVVLKPNS